VHFRGFVPSWLKIGNRHSTIDNTFVPFQPPLSKMAAQSQTHFDASTYGKNCRILATVSAAFDFAAPCRPKKFDPLNSFNKKDLKNSSPSLPTLARPSLLCIVQRTQR
jgi:hypothetical protein